MVMGPLKEHRENVLFEREQGLMPATQPEVVLERIRREVVSLRLDFMKHARQKADSVCRVHAPPEVEILRGFWDRVLHLHYREHRGKEPKKTKLIRKCPVTDCKGFLNKQWNCQLCTNTICRSCNEVKSQDHQCDPETVETVKLIRKDTKPCPTCGTLIFRASGCPQMWCVECHTTFDWNTGNIETGVIHNPHYYEYHRRNGTLQRNPGDVPCGGEPEVYQLQAFGERPVAMLRLIRHVRVYLPGLNRDPNRKNRIEYMIGDITEAQFKFRIQCREKALEKERVISSIFRMFVDVGTDLLRTLVADKNIRSFLKQRAWLIDYVNAELEKIREVFRTMVPMIKRDDIHAMAWECSGGVKKRAARVESSRK
jgi:hypothetical protein